MIRCQVQEASNVPTDVVFKGGVGLRHVVYDFAIAAENFPQDLLKKELLNETIIKNSLALSVESYSSEPNRTQKYWGIFTSKTAGEYLFILSGSHQAEIYFSKNKVDPTTELDYENGLDRICHLRSYGDFRKFFMFGI